ncbi:MAG: hypothetical protein IKI57_03680 [Clostridia bacterium]|nr:hypothetical protein [Clostridia bacterium]
MKKYFAVIVCILLCTIILTGCGEKPYREQEITSKNYTTIFRVENDLTEEEKECVNLATMQYAFTPDGMFGKTINDIIEEGKIIKADKEKKEEERKQAENLPENKFVTIQNEFVTEIWNELFVNISSYIYDGTDCMGREFDLERAMKKAEKAMEHRDEYNEYVKALDDSKYADLKEAWNNLLNEIDTLYAQIKDNPPKASDSSYDYSTTKLSNYMDDLDDALDDLK